MADTERTRVVANKGRKNRARHMSAKQIRIFGTPRQKAALRRKRAGSGSRKKKNRSHHHRKNAGEIVGFTLANTGRRKGHSHMAKTKSNRKRSHARKGHHAGGHSKRHHYMKQNKGHRRRRRNIGGGGGPGGVGHIAMNAVFVIAGALGSKLLTQMVLGSNNVGLIGYAGNAVAGGALWFVTEKVMRNRVASNGVIAGTAVQIILRLINDYTPFGQYVAQLGMGDYQAQSFVTPQVLVDPYNSAQIRIPGAWLPPPAPPPTTVSGASASAGVGSYGELYGGRSSLY